MQVDSARLTKSSVSSSFRVEPNSWHGNWSFATDLGYARVAIWRLNASSALAGEKLPANAVVHLMGSWTGASYKLSHPHKPYQSTARKRVASRYPRNELMDNKTRLPIQTEQTCRTCGHRESEHEPLRNIQRRGPAPAESSVDRGECNVDGCVCDYFWGE